MHFAIKSPTMAYIPEYLAGDCSCSSLGMVSPANVATLGAMELGRSTYSYDRAIARVKAKIKLLKKKRNNAKLKIRKNRFTEKIIKLQKKLYKLRAYKKVRIQKKLDKTGGDDVVIADDEDFILQDAMTGDPEIPMIDLQIEEEQMIANEGGMDWTRIAMFGGLAVLGIFGVKMVLGKKKSPRKNRLKMGRKANPKRRKSKRKVRKNRK